MLEKDVRILLRHLQRVVHVAEGGREDELVALRGEIGDHVLGIRAFGDILDIGGLHLVAEMRLRLLAADIVLIGPTEIADRTQIDKANLQRAIRQGWSDQTGQACGNKPRAQNSMKLPTIHRFCLRLGDWAARPGLRL